MLLGLAVVALGMGCYFFAKFEQAVLGLLILRSSLDVFSAQQIPSAFAIGLDALALLYVTVSLLTGQTIRTDRFWWFFAGWVALQGLWVILLPLGGLGMDASSLPEAIREWVRLFSWLMVYLLVMQLQERVHPEKIISALFFALILPLVAALLQLLLPPSLLPDILVTRTFEGYSRINGTLGHPNTFATFVLLFMALVCWQLSRPSRQRWFWLVSLGLLAGFYVGAKALFSLMMLAVFVLVLIAPKLNPLNLIGGVLLFALVIGLFASSPFGQERLSSIIQTPLLNPDISIDRAILLSHRDGNSFNWRLSQWTNLLGQWQDYPLLGYGLGVTSKISIYQNLAHNDYVRALVEGGIVGFISFLTFIFVQILRLLWLIRHAPIKEQKNLCLCMLAIFLSLPIGMLTENIWSHTTFFYYWFTLFAVAAWNWEQQPQENPLST